MKKRVLAALLVTMMTVGTVAGCGTRQNIERTYPAEYAAQRSVGYDMY
jgi:nitrogen regulatory protein PII